MNIGIVGYQGSGKSTLFHWLTGVAPDPALSHTTQVAMAVVPEPRFDDLSRVYGAKKLTFASLSLVDTPGLSRTQEGNAARLGLLRESGCLVLVVAGFGGIDPMSDLAAFEEDLLLADLQIMTTRVEKLKESTKKPRPNRDQELAELNALLPLLAVLEEGKSLHSVTMTEDQRKATNSFRLLTQKPKLILVNLADDDTEPQRFTDKSTPEVPIYAVPLGLELELGKMSEEDRKDFIEEMGVSLSDRNSVIQGILDTSGHLLYYTAGEKEVRTWMLRKGGTALEAADNIHSDLARGFIRAEVMHADDLIRLGSEREVKAAGLVTQEPKDYVVKSADILHIRFSV